MSQTVTELLSDQHKGIFKAQGILCYLFRHALLWRNVNQFSWNKRARLFFEKPHNKVHDKGNLNKTLTKDDFTWDAFKKAIDFLNALESTLCIRLTWSDQRVSEYSVVIDPTEEGDENSAFSSQVQMNEDGYTALRTSYWVDSTITDTGVAEEIFKEKKEPKGTLAALFRRIIIEENIDLKRWNQLFEDYVKDPKHGIPQNRRDINTAISTLQRDLLMPSMSWNNFRKGIIILNPIQEDYILELVWSKQPPNISTHSVTIRDPLSIKPMV